MKKARQRRIFSSYYLFFLFLLPNLFSCDARPIHFQPHNSKQLTILYLNDLHGQLEPSRADGGEILGGVARLATLVERIRSENNRLGHQTLLLVAGDLFLGSSLSAFFQGEAEVKFLNLVHPDALTLGNHEFDFGLEVLEQRVKDATFPVISANIYRNKERLLPPLVFRDMGAGLRVAILGLITPDTTEIAHPEKISGLTFSDPVAEAKKVVSEARRGSDILIALTHTGLEIDKRLAREVPGLHVIIGGHDHIALPEPLAVNGVLICQAQNRGLFLGRLDLRIEAKKVIKVAAVLMPVTEELQENQEVKEMVSSYRTKLDRQLKQVVGKNRTRLVGDPDMIRQTETNLGNLVADVMRKAARTEIALVNGGGIRGSIEEGAIILEDVWRVFPYDNQLVRLELSGKQIEEVLSHSVGLRPGLTGGFLQVSGLSFVIEPTGPREIRVDGKPLVRDRFYSVAITDFMYAGGDGYSHFQAGKNPLRQRLLIRDLFLSYLRENKEISAVVDGRIRRLQ